MRTRVRVVDINPRESGIVRWCNMTDRINSVTVVLTEDIREDDCEHVLNAIRMIRGVLSVKPHVADVEDLVANQRVRSEFRRKLLEVLDG